MIEELYADRISEFHETLAWHYVHGEAWPKAIEYLLKAADKARDQYAYAEAIRRCDEAIAIIDRHGGPRGEKTRALEALGDLHSREARLDPANEAYERALESTDDAAARSRIGNKRHRPGVVVRGGARIAYYEHGSGDPTLLLMHPLVFGLATYQAVLESLCQEFRIVTVDPRGCGRSDAVEGRYLLRDHAEDARAIIEAIGNRPVVFIGISQAGQLAVNFVTMYPHLVEKLILVGTTSTELSDDVPWPIPERRRERRAHARAQAQAGEYEKALQILWADIFTEPGSRNLLEARVQADRETPREAVQNFFRTWGTDPGAELRPLLTTLRVPTLVLHGDADQSVPVEAGRYLANHIPGRSSRPSAAAATRSSSRGLRSSPGRCGTSSGPDDPRRGDAGGPARR